MGETVFPKMALVRADIVNWVGREQIAKHHNAPMVVDPVNASLPECFCGEDINRVGKDCADIRVRGIIGSIAAFAVLTSSIALCGMGSKLYAKRREGASI